MNAPARKALSQGLASALLTFGLAGWLPAQNGKAFDFSKLVVVGDSLADQSGKWSALRIRGRCMDSPT
jgi:hypothetical protein